MTKRKLIGYIILGLFSALAIVSFAIFACIYYPYKTVKFSQVAVTNSPVVSGGTITWESSLCRYRNSPFTVHVFLNNTDNGNVYEVNYTVTKSQIAVGSCGTAHRSATIPNADPGNYTLTISNITRVHPQNPISSSGTSAPFKIAAPSQTSSASIINPAFQ